MPLVFAAVLAVAISSSVAVWAQTFSRDASRFSSPAPYVGIAFVDVDRVTEKVLFVQRMLEELECVRNALIAQNTALTGYLEGRETEIDQMRPADEADKANAEFEEAAREFDELVTIIRDHQDSKGRQLEAWQNFQLGHVSEALREVVATLGREQGLLFISSSPLWHDPRVNLNDAVLQRVNARLSDGMSIDAPTRAATYIDLNNKLMLPEIESGNPPNACRRYLVGVAGEN